MNELTLVNVVSLIADQVQDSTLHLFEAVTGLVVFPGVAFLRGRLRGRGLMGMKTCGLLSLVTVQYGQ